MKRGLLSFNKVKEAYEFTGYTPIDGLFTNPGRCGCPMTAVGCAILDKDIFAQHPNFSINNIIKDGLKMTSIEVESFYRGYDNDNPTFTDQLDKQAFNAGKRLRKQMIKAGMLKRGYNNG